MTRRLVPFVLVVVAAGCGSGPKSAADVQECVKKRLPAGAVDRIFTNTGEGVTSVNYFHKGGETDMSIFPSVDDAVSAERAEARLGDAHDKMIEQKDPAYRSYERWFEIYLAMTKQAGAGLLVAWIQGTSLSRTRITSAAASSSFCAEVVNW